MTLKEGALIPPYTDCWGTVEGTETVERITAWEPKKFWEESRMTPQKCFGTCVCGAERIYGSRGHEWTDPV